MCGIAGFYSFKADQNRQDSLEVAYRMEAAVAHRGPDGSDIWQDEVNGLTLIHRRLSVIDLSEDGAQPMHSPSGRYIITFNGEIYNYLELRRDLEAQGIKFRGASDTEVMLAGFDHWGVEKALSKINGMFAFALWDQVEQYLHLSRDRFGKKPLYVGWIDNALVFASELKAFHAYPNFSREINQDALAIYMKYGYVHAPYSIFQNIWQLLPASVLSLDLSSIRVGENLADKMKIFWSLKDVVEEGQRNPIKKSDAIIIEEFEEKLSKCVSQRMISDVPLGAFLSGGIDSSVVVALMNQHSDEAVKTFTVGFDQVEFNEAEYAKKIATHLGTDHHEFYCSDQDALNVIPNLPIIYDEPFADESQIPTYLISALAREHVTVVLTGDGGDEILAGYDRHTKLPNLWNKIGWAPHVLRQMVCDALGLVPQEFYQKLRSNNPRFGSQVKRVLYLMGLKDTDSIYDSFISAWLGGDDVVLNGHLPNIPVRNKSEYPSNLSFFDEMVYLDTLSYRSDDLMVKMDRASMAVALEGRAPLMDYELAEYSWRMPQHLKVKNGKGKWVLREILKHHIPEELYDRPKMGFCVPLNEWLQGPLKEWANDLLDPTFLKNQGLLNEGMVTDQWKNFQNEKIEYKNRRDIWAVLMFQAWYNQWMR